MSQQSFMAGEDKAVNYDVIVLGGGMTGLAMALSLAEYDFSVCLIEHADLQKKMCLPPRYDARVSAVTEASYHFLKNMGVWTTTDMSRVCDYSDMEVWDADGIGRVKFHARDIGYMQLGWIVENAVITAGLLGRLMSGSVKLLDQTQVTGIQQDAGHVSVSCDCGKIISGRLLIAADGAHSQVRKWAGIPVKQKDCLHHAIVCNIQTSTSHQHCARQVFIESGPLAFLPLPATRNAQGEKNYHSSIVWSLTPGKARKVMAMDDAAFCHALTRMGEGCAGEVLLATPRASIPLVQRHASFYSRGRIVLVGDAAHTIHPLAGQGVNLGFLDVAVLSEELLRAYRRDDDIGGAHILNRYQRRRQGHNQMMLIAMNGFQQLFHHDALLVRYLRNTGMQLVDNHMLLKKQIIRYAVGLSGDIPEIMRMKN